ncbi:MAG: ATP-binding cassette domain-containing protein [Shimia sp.]
MIFSLRDLTFRYGSPPAISVDALDIPQEGVTAIIGPSGSGKTTLLSILAGFLTPRMGPEGRLFFDGAPMPARGRPDIAFVFQSPMLLGPASALANILQGRAAGRGKPPLEEAELAKLIAEVGLARSDGALLSARARTLSGGEAQRMAALRAILADPRAILCDEPTSALDEPTARALMSTLRHWSRSRKRPVIWVTHNLEQAARYADRYVFVSGGKVLPRDAARDRAMSDQTPEERLRWLRAITRELKGAPMRTTAVRAGAGTVPLSPRRYAGWIAAALSRDGLPAEEYDRQNATTLLPSALAALLHRMAPSAPERPSWGRRAWAGLRSYARVGPALVLWVLMIQVCAALFFGDLARDYARTQLQDPSVARLVFEHDAGRLRLGEVEEPEELFADTTLPALDARLEAEIDGEVQLFGRRSIAASQLRFDGVAEACAGWQPFGTVALDAGDPLIRQTDLIARPEMLADPAAIQARAQAAAEARTQGAPVPERVALMDANVVALLERRCGVEPGAPITASWAAGPAGQLDPLELRIVGAFSRPPPIYPNAAQLIVFEHDYLDALNRSDGRPPDSFGIATAYFPIDAFDTARRVLIQAGYTIRDDSAEAVRTLRRIAAIANVAPGLLIGFNLAAAAMVVLLTLGQLLELNRRVFALFMAQGFRLIDLMRVMALHLLPAFAIAAVLLAVLVYGLWLAIGPEQGGGIRDAAVLRAILGTFCVCALALTLTCAIWWRQTKDRLKTYLQD